MSLSLSMYSQISLNAFIFNPLLGHVFQLDTTNPSAGGSFGDLTSPTFPATGPECLQFWYQVSCLFLVNEKFVYFYAEFFPL